MRWSAIAVRWRAVAQFYYATLLDPDLKLSTIVAPDANKAIGWYQRAANQGDQSAMSNLAISYYFGIMACGRTTRGPATMREA